MINIKKFNDIFKYNEDIEKFSDVSPDSINFTGMIYKQKNFKILNEIGIYRNGFKEGISREWDDLGNINKESFFDNDGTGYLFEWNEKGLLCNQIVYFERNKIYECYYKEEEIKERFYKKYIQSIMKENNIKNKLQENLNNILEKRFTNKIFTTQLKQILFSKLSYKEIIKNIKLLLESNIRNNKYNTVLNKESVNIKSEEITYKNEIYTGIIYEFSKNTVTNENFLYKVYEVERGKKHGLEIIWDKNYILYYKEIDGSLQLYDSERPVIQINYYINGNLEEEKKNIDIEYKVIKKIRTEKKYELKAVEKIPEKLEKNMKKYLEKLKEKYDSEEIKFILPSENSRDLNKIPAPLKNLYENTESIELPFGYTYSIDEALKLSESEPFKSQDYFVFGHDYDFNFWLCKFNAENNLYFTSWYESCPIIDEPEISCLSEFLEDFQEDEEIF